MHACYLYELFSGVRHGFALRGSMENGMILNTNCVLRVLTKFVPAWARKRCADSFISWADRFMVEPFVSKEEDCVDRVEQSGP